MKKKALIFAVDDEENILELVDYVVTQGGFSVRRFSTGEAALSEIKQTKPDLLILDLMLPGVDGISVCRQLKNDQNLADIPIIMLTAKGEEADIVTGLELGADDYIPKPFSPKVLIARVKAVLRRNKQEFVEEGDLIRAFNISIHQGKREVTVDDQFVELTNSEFRLLHFLASRPGWVFTRYQIVDAVRGEDYPVTERAIDVQVVGLRKKLGESGKYIETVRGVGYRFKEIK
jgi:two-component system phosphate regulon response regulator PhoB